MRRKPELADISAELRRLRRRNSVLRVFSVVLACFAAFALVVARYSWADGGNYARLQWPALTIAGLSVVLMLPLSAIREKQSQ
jgi:hypothetical protein